MIFLNKKGTSAILVVIITAFITASICFILFELYMLLVGYKGAPGTLYVVFRHARACPRVTVAGKPAH